jgi:hypothetical protein
LLIANLEKVANLKQSLLGKFTRLIKTASTHTKLNSKNQNRIKLKIVFFCHDKHSEFNLCSIVSFLHEIKSLNSTHCYHFMSL